MSKPEINLTIKQSIRSEIDTVPDHVANIIEQLSSEIQNNELLYNIKLCLEEALINAVKHGNQEDISLSVQVEVYCTAEEVYTVIADEGEGFDSSHIPDPTLPENVMQSHGRGIFIISKYSDQVEFLNSGRTIKIIHKRKG
ncbi:MAG: ATP-binding protein [Candidatus Omnitrophica bacterium]|nr:ATP-binding protein [Candidatus Omnitrophota bacterium]